MSKPVRTLITCLLLLAAAEFGLRRLLDRPRGGVPEPATLAFCLGTSRTMRGLDPAVLEAELREGGIGDAWVANVSQNAITTVGLYQLYMHDLRPAIAGRHALVAIEARPSGLNDAYLTEDENEAFTSGELRTLFFSGDLGDEFRVGGKAAALARRWFGRLRLAGGRKTFDELKERLRGGDAAPFTLGSRGFIPDTGRRRDDLDQERWRYHYEQVLLRPWRFGAVQIEALRFLIRQVRTDGHRPVLYVMPVTEIQRGFWPKGVYPGVIEALYRVAREENVDLVDLDAPRDLPVEAFQDTHHLTPAAAAEFSRRFAREVLLPRLR